MDATPALASSGGLHLGLTPLDAIVSEWRVLRKRHLRLRVRHKGFSLAPLAPRPNSFIMRHTTGCPLLALSGHFDTRSRGPLLACLFEFWSTEIGTPTGVTTFHSV